MTIYKDIPLINNEAEHNFEMMINGRQAFINYRKKGDTYLLIHTEVPEVLQGQGVAATLVEKTFKYLEKNNLKMFPYCAYIHDYLKKHPEWRRLIAEQH